MKDTNIGDMPRKENTMARLGPSHQLSVNIPYALYEEMHQMISEGKAKSLRGIVEEGIKKVLKEEPVPAVS